MLMAADILLYDAEFVPVGKDQTQHLEMARDIAQRFNHHFGEVFVLPETVVQENGDVLQGLDGRKMSKSYNNTIPLFLGEKQLQKHINKIKTNLQEPGEPKNPDESTVFQIWQAFATDEQAAEMRPGIALISDMCLGLFLTMALMGLQLWKLQPVLGFITVAMMVQITLAVGFTLLLVFRAMGRNYEAAVISAAFGGIALGSTATAVANMTAVTRQFGAAPQAFIVVPLVCGFTIDLGNALVIGMLAR